MVFTETERRKKRNYSHIRPIYQVITIPVGSAMHQEWTSITNNGATQHTTPGRGKMKECVERGSIMVYLGVSQDKAACGEYFCGSSLHFHLSLWPSNSPERLMCSCGWVIVFFIHSVVVSLSSSSLPVLLSGFSSLRFHLCLVIPWAAYTSVSFVLFFFYLFRGHSYAFIGASSCLIVVNASRVLSLSRIVHITTKDAKGL